jgi:hypothetical protein
LFGNALGDRLLKGPNPCGNLASGGFRSNIDNAYAYAFVSRGFGPVVVFHGKVPTFAATYPDARVMPGGVQLQPQGVVLYRQMLASPSFGQAIQHVAYGSEKSQMGPYYPSGRYFAGWRAVAKAYCS